MNNPYLTTEDIMRIKIPNWDNMNEDERKIAQAQYYYDINLQEQKEQSEARKAKHEATRNTYLLLPEYRNCHFAYSDDTNKGFVDICHKYVDNLPEMKRLKAGICFCGDVGVGKTFMLACMANEMIRKYDEKPLMATLSELTTRLLSSDTEKHWVWEYAKACPVLVLDDFGVERQTEFMLEKTFELFDARTQLGNAVTIISTNLKKEQVQSQQSSLQLERIYSRLRQLCPVVKTIHDVDRRSKPNADRIKEIESMLG